MLRAQARGWLYSATTRVPDFIERKRKALSLAACFDSLPSAFSHGHSPARAALTPLDKHEAPTLCQALCLGSGKLNGTGTSHALSCCDTEGRPPLVIQEVLIERSWAQDYRNAHIGILDTTALTLEIQTPCSLEHLWVPQSLLPTCCVAWGHLRSTSFPLQGCQGCTVAKLFPPFARGQTLPFPSSFTLGTADFCGLLGTFICQPVCSQVPAAI